GPPGRVLDARRAAARLAPGPGAGAGRPPAPAGRRRLGVGGFPRLAQAADPRRRPDAVPAGGGVRRLVGVVPLRHGRGGVGRRRGGGTGGGGGGGGVFGAGGGVKRATVAAGSGRTGSPEATPLCGCPSLSHGGGQDAAGGATEPAGGSLLWRFLPGLQLPELL